MLFITRAMIFLITLSVANRKFQVFCHYLSRADHPAFSGSGVLGSVCKAVMFERYTRYPNPKGKKANYEGERVKGEGFFLNPVWQLLK